MGLFTKVFGTYSQRELKSIYPIVDKITALEEDYKKLTDAQLQAKTPEFKELAPSYAERNGGYTRIIRTGVRRGDAAETAVIELVK